MNLNWQVCGDMGKLEQHYKSLKLQTHEFASGDYYSPKFADFHISLSGLITKQTCYMSICLTRVNEHYAILRSVV